MRILHVHSGNLYGGVETVLRCFALAHGNEEHEFAFSFEGRIAQELRSLGSQVYALGEIHARDPFSILGARHALAAICRGGRFDATVVHSSWALGLLGRAAIRPLVFYQHDVLSGSHWTERFARRAAPNLIIANSAYTARSTARAFAGQGAVVVYPPADIDGQCLPIEQRHTVRTRWGASDAQVVVLIAARFEPWKGHQLLLDALAQIRANPRWTLWIAGQAQRPHEQRLREELLKFVDNAGITERVRLLGHVEDVGGLMQAADIYCQPNTEPEPFGLTFIEALHARIPVVTTRLGGAEEILTPETGYLLPPRAEAVAGTLEALIDNAELRRCIGELGRVRALEVCDPRKQVARFVRSIETLRQVRAA